MINHHYVMKGDFSLQRTTCFSDVVVGTDVERDLLVVEKDNIVWYCGWSFRGKVLSFVDNQPHEEE